MGEIITLGLALFYFIYSLSFSWDFYQNDSFYSKKQKIVHLCLVWLIPFLWIGLLKYLNQKRPGSDYYSKKRREKPFDDDEGRNSTFHESGAGF